jgi:hypothetical protein
MVIIDLSTGCDTFVPVLWNSDRASDTYVPSTEWASLDSTIWTVLQWLFIRSRSQAYAVTVWRKLVLNWNLHCATTATWHLEVQSWAISLQLVHNILSAPTTSKKVGWNKQISLCLSPPPAYLDFCAHNPIWTLNHLIVIDGSRGTQTEAPYLLKICANACH